MSSFISNTLSKLTSIPSGIILCAMSSLLTLGYMVHDNHKSHIRQLENDNKLKIQAMQYEHEISKNYYKNEINLLNAEIRNMHKNIKDTELK
jgi:hypothetical protein